jgi:hypothetical protein
MDSLAFSMIAIGPDRLARRPPRAAQAGKRSPRLGGACAERKSLYRGNT